MASEYAAWGGRGARGDEGFSRSTCSGSSRALPRDPMRAESQSCRRDRPHKFKANMPRSKIVTSVAVLQRTLLYSNLVKQIRVAGSVQPAFGGW